MRNLLWKFIALAGVMGIGLMVVLQTLDGLSVDPDLGARQVSASPHENHNHHHPPQPPPPASGIKPPPPLRTEESVALAKSAPAAVSTDPFAQKTAPDSAGEFPPAKGNPFPALAEADAMDIPPAFPAIPIKTQPVTQAILPEQPELPALPILIPTGGTEPASEADVAEANAFAAEQDKADSGSSSAPPQTPPMAQQSVAEADPFADPVPPAKTQETEPAKIPFDPYEPPANDAAGPDLPPLPAPAGPEGDAPANEEPESFPLLPEPEPLAADPKQQPAPIAPAPAEASASRSPFPTEAEPAPVEEPALPQAAPKEDDPQKASSETPPAAAPLRSPGRATVRIPSDAEIPFAPPAEDEPLQAEFSNEPLPAQAKESTEKTVSAPPTAGDPPAQADQELQPFPDMNAPSLAGPQMNKGPECAVPPRELSGAPKNPTQPEPLPFVDPLDQLTFPEAEPPRLAIQEPAGAVSPAGARVEAKTEPVSQPPRNLNTLPNINPGPRVAEAEGSAPALLQSATPPPAKAAVPPGTGVGALSSAPGQQSPELKIEKTAPPKAALGQPMVYHILVRNVGQTAAHEVIVEDQIPQGTKLTGTIPRGELADNRLIWRLGVIPPGEEKKIAVRVIPTQEGSVGSVAKVSFVAEVAARTVIAAPKLELEFTGPKKAVLGEDVIYHFKVANTGTGDVSKVFLRNILPEGLVHPDGNDLEYEVGLLKAGESREIDLTVNAAKAGEFVNKAIISAGGNLQKEATSALKIIGDRLTITRTGPKRRYVGRLASFSNTITNQTETVVAPVRVVEVVPAGMDFVEATAGGKYDPDKRTVTWAIAQLGPREKQLLKLELVARQEGEQASEVTAYDPNGTRAVVKSETVIDGYTALRLDVREYDEPVDVGDQVAIRVVATNRGTRAASEVIVSMQIPEELEFVSAKGPVDFKRDGATLTFKPVKSLKGRTEIEFDLVMKSIKPGDARLRLEISSTGMTEPLTREEGIRILANRP